VDSGTFAQRFLTPHPPARSFREFSQMAPLAVLVAFDAFGPFGAVHLPGEYRPCALRAPKIVRHTKRVQDRAGIHPPRDREMQQCLRRGRPSPAPTLPLVIPEPAPVSRLALSNPVEVIAAARLTRITASEVSARAQAPRRVRKTLSISVKRARCLHKTVASWMIPFGRALVRGLAGPHWFCFSARSTFYEPEQWMNTVKPAS